MSLRPIHVRRPVAIACAVLGLLGLSLGGVEVARMVDDAPPFTANATPTGSETDPKAPVTATALQPEGPPEPRPARDLPARSPVPATAASAPEHAPRKTPAPAGRANASRPAARPEPGSEPAGRLSDQERERLVADGLASPPTKEEAGMTLENTCPEPIELVWLTFDGDERPYTEIAPGGLYVQGSFEGHRWLLRGLESGRELARFGAQPDFELQACGEPQGGAPASEAPREAVCSGTNGPPMVVSVESRCPEPLTLHWVSFGCQRKSYGVVNPNGLRLQPTFAGHAWLLVNAAGQTVSSYLADPTEPRFIAECP